jgi:hypothetical protein
MLTYLHASYMVGRSHSIAFLRLSVRLDAGVATGPVGVILVLVALVVLLLVACPSKCLRNLIMCDCLKGVSCSCSDFGGGGGGCGSITDFTNAFCGPCMWCLQCNSGIAGGDRCKCDPLCWYCFCSYKPCPDCFCCRSCNYPTRSTASVTPACDTVVCVAPPSAQQVDSLSKQSVAAPFAASHVGHASNRNFHDDPEADDESAASSWPPLKPQETMNSSNHPLSVASRDMLQVTDSDGKGGTLLPHAAVSARLVDHRKQRIELARERWLTAWRENFDAPPGGFRNTHQNAHCGFATIVQLLLAVVVITITVSQWKTFDCISLVVSAAV